MAKTPPHLLAKANEYAKAHRVARCRYMKKWMRRLREEVLAAYGGACKCCGVTYHDWLAMDHINGKGTRHVGQVSREGYTLTRWLKKENFPAGFQILCHNCNWAKYRGGCPHQAGG